MPELEFTGERVVPGLVDPNLFNEHLARYRFAAQYAQNARVLDAGCGSGYGTAELACAATSVVGMDISAEAVAHARRTFDAPNIRFLQGSCEALPFADASFDVVAAFEVIEHLEGWQQLLTEARRVLGPAGVLLVSTPNKAWYAESRADAGPNPYHVHEFEYREFEAALAAVFPHVHLWSQNHSEAISFVPTTASFGRLDASLDAAPEHAHFFLAACSQSPIPNTASFGWLPSAGNVLRERQRHIALLEREVAKKNAWLADAQRAQAALQASYDHLAEEMRERNLWAKKLDRELEIARGVMDELRAEFDATRAGYELKISELEADVAARLEWVRSVEAALAARTEWAQSLDTRMRQEREVFRSLEADFLQSQQHLVQTREELLRVRSELEFVEATRWVRLGRRLRALPEK